MKRILTCYCRTLQIVVTKNRDILEQLNTTARPSRRWFYFSALGALMMIWGITTATNSTEEHPLAHEELADECIEDAESSFSQHLFGFNTDIFHFFEGKIKPNQVLGNLFIEYGLPQNAINTIIDKSKEVFNVRQIRPGKRFAFVHGDPCQIPDYFVYEPDPYRFILFNTAPPYDVKVIEREVETQVEAFQGTIESSLWMAMKAEGMSHSLISKMEDALAWTVDFHTIQKGDQFKLLFERKLIEGEAVGIGQLLGAKFSSGGKDFVAIYYENENYKGYYDLEGRPTKRAFLKAPVKFSRISSGFNPKRFHPVLKRYKAHLGTDYAAPSGTPIYAVANGTITKANYTRNNGNYVKIRHDKTYETQYLHMKGFARGIRPGVKVRQGDVIGYVGQTGLATGPHVCFRFWKNGRQVDHRRLNFPPPQALPESELVDFYNHKDAVIKQLNQLLPAQDELLVNSYTGNAKDVPDQQGLSNEALNTVTEGTGKP